MEDKNIVWLTREFEISKLTFPITVKFEAGVDFPNDSIIDGTTTLTLHGKDQLSSAFGYDSLGRAFNLPIKCTQKVSVAAPNGTKVFPTVRELCKLQFLPRYIRNDLEFVVYDIMFAKNTIFEVNMVGIDPDYGLLGLSVESIGPQAVRMMLPSVTKGNFKEYMLPYDVNQLYVIEELKARKLPLFLEFNDNHLINPLPRYKPTGVFSVE